MSAVKNPIRVDIPSDTIRILKIDKNRFNMASMNELYNTVINNYVDESPVNMRDLITLKKILQEEAKDLSADQIRNIIDRVARNSIKDLQVDNPRDIVSISVKPTQISEEGFQTLNHICNVDHFSSMTKAIRNLLISYSKLTVIEREKIICKKMISDLKYAIENHLQVSITHKEKDYLINPCLLVTPLDDFSNYLIAQDQNKKYRLFRIITIKLNKVIEYSIFTMPDAVQKELQKYKEDGMTVFNTDISNALKKVLNHEGNDEVFPNVINQIRGSSGKERVLKAK